MITLGMILSKLLNGNPSIVVMATEDMKKGVAVEINGIKLAKVDGREVLVLTI